MANRDDQYFGKYLDENFKDIKDDIREVKVDTREITRHVEKINGRLTRVESKVFPRAETSGQLVPFYRDPQVLRLLSILAVGVVLMLVIYAGLKGISIPTGIL